MLSLSISVKVVLKIRCGLSLSTGESVLPTLGAGHEVARQGADRHPIAMDQP
jgi:hypothetical protein